MSQKKIVNIADSITVDELAGALNLPVTTLIGELFKNGIVATINQRIDFETAVIVVEELGLKDVELKKKAKADVVTSRLQKMHEVSENAKPRPPIVAVMGHVDHGKTTLLDTILGTKTVSGEAGGITQHISAYQTERKGRKITLLDTPGHEAFAALRQHGATLTDVVIIVVAADDGVKPQTVEAIRFAQNANAKIVVAINKMDKDTANKDRVMAELSERGLMPEEWGGDVTMVPISAKNGDGIDDLLDMVILTADLEELRADVDIPAEGLVIESHMEVGKGSVVSLLVEHGELKQGGFLVAGTTYAKVRTLQDYKGGALKSAGPSTPVTVTGFKELPQFGDVFKVVKNEKEARNLAQKAKIEATQNAATANVTGADLLKMMNQKHDAEDFNIVIKADVQGSVEALRQSLEGIKNPEVRIVIVHAAVGAINESDIMLASASNAIVMGFNVRPDANVRRAAEQEKVDLRTYRVIYDAINDVESAMRGMLAPQFKEVVVGRAEVRQVISTPKAIVAGSYVTEGRITNDSEVRLIRDGIVVFEGKVDSLRRFKDEVKEVKTSFECGISLEGYRDIKEGDVIEAYLMEEIAPQL